MTRQIYIAIDDTDNATDASHRGTGARARELASRLEYTGLGHGLGVTRHQLLVDRRIPYTSHNSAACLLLESDAAAATIAGVAADFLVQVAAPGSDAGLCVAEVARVPDEVIAFGKRAKQEVLTAAEAHLIAEDAGVHLSGHTGLRIGVIGALAAVGLRHSGQDGRFLQLNGFRTLMGIQSVGTLRDHGIQRFRSENTQILPQPGDVVDLGAGTKAILRDGVPTLLVEAIGRGNVTLQWRAAPKARIHEF